MEAGMLHPCLYFVPAMFAEGAGGCAVAVGALQLLSRFKLAGSTLARVGQFTVGDDH